MLYRLDGYEEEEKEREGDDGDDGKMKRNFLARGAWTTRAGGGKPQRAGMPRKAAKS